VENRLAGMFNEEELLGGFEMTATAEETKRGNRKGKSLRSYTTEEEKYIVEKVDTAKAEGLEVKVVLKCLADEFNVTHGAITQKYYGLKKKAVQGKLDFDIELGNPRIPETIKTIGHVGYVPVVEEPSQEKEKEKVGDETMGETTNQTVRETTTLIKETQVQIIQDFSSDPILAGVQRVIQERDDYKRKYEEAMNRLRTVEKLLNV
jgi:hypothetical protein